MTATPSSTATGTAGPARSSRAEPAPVNEQTKVQPLRRLGIYGGTFDPVHWGHLLLAESAREQLDLDAVWFVPADRPVHKQEATISEPRHRIQMLEFATTGLPRFDVSRVEIGKDAPAYTVDTLARLSSEHPDVELFFLIGGDSLSDLPTWKDPERIVELATLVAFNRGDTRLVVPDESAGYADRIVQLSMPACGLSATDLRHRAKTGQSLLFRTPRSVELYIQQHKLYR